jgi:hypothetical protein
MKNILLLNSIIFFFLFIGNKEAIAQEKKERTIFEKGTIVCSQTGRIADERHRASEIPYDPYIIGVATGDDNRLHVYDLLQNDGIAQVRYNSENGVIKKGDFVTSSTTRGVAMKAASSGMVLGVAMEDADKKEGLLKIRILIQYIHADK